MIVPKAQQPDGFVHAVATNKKRPAWAEEALPVGHGGYVQGRMIEAADAECRNAANRFRDCAAWRRLYITSIAGPR